jgi:hypothetical protein
MMQTPPFRGAPLLRVPRAFYRSPSPWHSTVFGGDKTIGEPVTRGYVCV